MYEISPVIASGLTRSHARGTKVECFRDTQRVARADEFEVLNGTITLDATAAVRRRLSVTLRLPDRLMPTAGGDAFAPFGNELRVTTTVIIDNGATVDIPLGVFRISAPKTVDRKGRTVQITGYDRSRSIARARMTAPRTILAGQNYVTAIKALIDSRMANLVWSAVPTTYITPLINVDIQADPWDKATDMATSIGYELYIDGYGGPVLRPEPDPTTVPPVASYEEGATATILSLESNLSDEPGYNIAVVIGQPSSGAPVFAVRSDDNPNSATFSKGPYGQVPTFLKSQYIATQAQADAAAVAELRRVLGIAERVTFTAVPHPALEVGDAIRLRRAASRVDDVYVIESIAFPLRHTDDMTVVARRRKTA